MTSATLAVDGNLGYFKQRIGAHAAAMLQVGSPFDYARQMCVEIPRGMPDPQDTERYVEAVVRAVKHFIAKTHGAVFVLFTSDKVMRRVVEQVHDFFQEQNIHLLVQGTGMPHHAMLENFQKDPSSVLFGLDNFWIGVDVQGEALRNVIITRLPFAVPGQPVVKARMDRIREQGGDAFGIFVTGSYFEIPAGGGPVDSHGVRRGAGGDPR